MKIIDTLPLATLECLLCLLQYFFWQFISHHVPCSYCRSKPSNRHNTRVCPNYVQDILLEALCEAACTCPNFKVLKMTLQLTVCAPCKELYTGMHSCLTGPGLSALLYCNTMDLCVVIYIDQSGAKPTA